MKMIDLFAGFGGFSLAGHWMGWETLAFVEKEDYPQRVLKKNFPGVPIYGDIYNLIVDSNANLLYLCENRDIIMGRKKLIKYNESVSLYNSGMSIQDCAEFFEITRQAMHKILQRRGCNFRDNLKHSNDNHFYRGSETNTKKRRVQHLTEKALKKGILIRPSNCSKCNENKSFKDGRSGIQAHHNDYNKPLEVRWLCQKCHHIWHKTNEAKNNEKEPTGEQIDIITGGFP